MFFTAILHVNLVVNPLHQ